MCLFNNSPALQYSRTTAMPQESQMRISNKCLVSCVYHEHVAGDWVGQVRDRGGGIVATSAFVWGLTSGAAAWFVTWSPVMMDTNTNTYSHAFMLPGVRMNCASFGLGRLSDVESYSTTLRPRRGSQAGSKSFGNSPPIRLFFLELLGNSWSLWIRGLEQIWQMLLQ